MDCRWIFPTASREQEARQLAREMSIPLFVARLLVGKGFSCLESAEPFLNPRLRSLRDPFELEGMDAVVNRIDAALRGKESIVLYGDYDVDGVASLALLARILRAYGGNVSCFLPVRIEEGYGLSDAGIERCFEEYSPKLLIAVDCGTNAVRQIAEARRRGADVLVLDHHEPEGERPEYTAIVNPKLQGAYEYLCSAGVAFKVCHALLKRSPAPGIDLREYLDFVALATLADLVSLVDENRTLVRSGLAQMGVTRWCGLSALMEVSGVRPPVRGSDVGFRLGPRINAAGRLANALQALQLLLTDDVSEARRIAASLDAQNRERQAVERGVAMDAERWVDENMRDGIPSSIVVGGRDWHQGVVGIVASRLCRRWHRPTLVVGFGPDGRGKGSGRSIEGFSLIKALGRCGDMLDAFGGHEMAAGLSVQEDRFDDFRAAFTSTSDELTDPEMLVARIHLDAEVSLDEVDYSFLEAQEMLEPFGMANAQPLLVARAVAPIAEPRILKEKHLRFEFAADRRRVSAIYFNGAQKDLPRPPWDLAFRIERNEYNGSVNAQIHVVAIRSAA